VRECTISRGRSSGRVRPRASSFVAAGGNPSPLALWGREGLDAIDGTPVLDIKPAMVEILPRTPVRQPAWSLELMRNYWR
jgi:hypothetical protein